LTCFNEPGLRFSTLIDMNIDFVTILLYIAVFSFGIPLVTGAINFGRLDRQMRLLLLLVVIIGTTESMTFYFSEILHRDYHWIHHIYLPIEYAILTLIFSSWIRHPLISRLLRFSIPFFWVFSIFNSFLLQNLKDLNSYSITLSLIVYTVMSLYVLFQIMSEDTGHVIKNHIFWISSGLLIFSAGDLAYFAFYSLIRTHYLIAIWATHTILNIAMLIFYSIGFICQGRKWE
jgi:hypothetical protein